MASIKQNKFYYRNAVLPSTDSQGAYDPGKAFLDFQFLNNKLSNVTKQLTSYDFYKITQVATDKADYEVKIASLLPNSALVINTLSSFTINNNTYASGDIVYKKNDNEIVKITADKGGIYYPKTVTYVNGNYNFTYEYLASTPEGGNPAEASFVQGVATIDTPKQTIVVKGFSVAPSGSTYAAIKKKSEATISGHKWNTTVDALIINNNPLIPVIKFFKYKEDNNNYLEEVSINLKAQYVNNNDAKYYSLSNIPDFIDEVIFK